MSHRHPRRHRLHLLLHHHLLRCPIPIRNPTPIPNSNCYQHRFLLHRHLHHHFHRAVVSSCGWCNSPCELVVGDGRSAAKQSMTAEAITEARNREPRQGVPPNDNLIAVQESGHHYLLERRTFILVPAVETAMMVTVKQEETEQDCRLRQRNRQRNGLRSTLPHRLGESFWLANARPNPWFHVSGG
ncbi:hypothetical protein GW17_00032533 [Ensete ventricosum]|nr:hypothetical protein GW17_00032533 [Ensete ventricosum]